MKSQLSAQFPLHTVFLSAELGVEQKRPDLAFLLRSAPEAPLTAETIRTLAPVLDATGAERVLAQCRTLGLVDAAGRPTEAGHHCARTGTALVPESGLYALLVGHHASVGRHVFGFRRVSGHPQDRRTDDLDPIDGRLGPDPAGVRRTDLLHGGRQFALRALHAPPGETPLSRVHENVGHARLEWTLDLETGENSRRLTLTVPATWAPESRSEPRPVAGPVTLAMSPVAENLVRGLLPAWAPEWSEADGFLRTRDNGAAPGPLAFRRTLQIPTAPVPGHGTFADIEVKDVPIGPEDAVAAAAWAHRLHRERLIGEHRYLSGPTVEALFEEVVVDTPLAGFAPCPPNVDELIDTLATDPRPNARKAAARLAAVRDVCWTH